MCSPTLFTPTFQYFYTDISVIFVTFRNSGSWWFRWRSWSSRSSSSSSDPSLEDPTLEVLDYHPPPDRFLEGPTLEVLWRTATSEFSTLSSAVERSSVSGEKPKRSQAESRESSRPQNPNKCSLPDFRNMCPMSMILKHLQTNSRHQIGRLQQAKVWS